MAVFPLLSWPNIFPRSSSPGEFRESFSLEEGVELFLGDISPREFQGILTLRGFFMETLEIDLESFSEGDSQRIPIPLPKQPGRYCLEGILERAGEKKRYFWILYRGELSDYIPFYLRESSFEGLRFFEEMKRWEKSRILGKLKAYGKDLYPGETLLALLPLSQRREGVFTSRRLLVGKEEVSFSRMFSHWKDGSERLMVESLAEPGRALLSLSLPSSQRNVLFAFFSRLLKLPPEIRCSSFEGASPFSFPSLKEMVERKKAFSRYSALGAVLLLSLSALLAFLFLQGTSSSLAHWGKGAFLGAFFILFPLYSLLKGRSKGTPLASSDPALLGEYTPGEIEDLRGEIIKEQNLTSSFPLYVFPSVSPTILVPSSSWSGKLKSRGLSISSHLFHSLDPGELKALLTFEMIKVEKGPALSFEMFHLSFGLFLFVLCLAAPFPLWIFLILLGFIWGEALFSYGKRKFSHLGELLLLERIGKTKSPLALINSWIKAGVRREICARLELLGSKILANLYPGKDRKEWWNLTEQVKEELPQGFIPLEEAMDLLIERVNSAIPGGIQREELEVYFDSLRINWRDFDNLIEDNQLDERELIPFLEALQKNPLPLFPLLPPRPGEPRVEEKILFLAIHSDKIPFEGR